MGSAAIFGGNYVKFLKDKLNLRDKAYILTGTADPTVTATDAPSGSLYLLQGTPGHLYVKLDNGSTTNWSKADTNSTKIKADLYDPASTTFPAVKFVSSLSSDNFSNIAGGSPSNFDGQTFNSGPGVSNISNISVWLKKDDTVTDYLNLAVFNVSAGLPTTLLGYSDTINTSVISSYEYRKITFRFPVPLPISASTSYAFAIAGTHLGGNIQYEINTTDPYASGQRVYSTDAGMSWGAIPSDDLKFAVSFNAPTVDGQTVAGEDTLFMSNASGGAKIAKADALTSTWVTLTPFENASSHPTVGDIVHIQGGANYQNQEVLLNYLNDFVINDITRYFDATTKTNFWEQSSLKTVTLADNTVNGTVFSVGATASENWIVNYSLNRGGIKETGQVYITHDGTTASASVTNTYTGAPGVTFDAIISGGNLLLRFTSTNTGVATTMKFFYQRWSDSAGGPSGVPSYTSSISLTPAAGTTGDVQYKGSSGNLDADTEFKWDTTDKAINLNGYKHVALAAGTVLDNQPTPAVFTTWPQASVSYMIIEYSLSRGGDVQVGHILLAHNGTTPAISDSNVGTIISLGVVFSADLSGGDLRLLYTSTNTGSSGSVKYTVKRWA